MVKTKVKLASGKEIEVRRLGMYELDGVPKDIPPPYTVTILFANGEVFEQQVELATPRRKPDKPFEACEENENDYYDWKEYYTWQAGLNHARKQYEAYCDYCDRVAQYVRNNCILTKTTDADIVTDDWSQIYHAALCPQVTMEDIIAALQRNF